MNLPELDNTRIDPTDKSLYYQSVKLAKEVEPQPARTEWDEITGERHDYPAKKGLYVAIDPYEKFHLWLHDGTIKKSETSFWFVMEIAMIKFPEKHGELRDRLAPRLRTEFDLTLSQMKNEWEHTGRRGYQNLVRLDGSISKSWLTVDLRNDEVNIRKK